MGAARISGFNRSAALVVWWKFLVLLSAFAGGLKTAGAETLYALSGWVQPASLTFSSWGEYVLMNDPLDRVRAILSDPGHRCVLNLPARLRIQAAITQARGPGDEPVFRIVAQEVVVSTLGSPDPAGSEGWNALTSELYAAEMNVVPRLAAFVQKNDPDGDGDGTPDNKDAFPGRPEEWRDADQDGTGDNADPDDDNDGMSDYYELLTGLNPYVADAIGDADGDGASNGEEALAGTLANDASSVFILTCSLDSAASRLRIKWRGLTTRIYAVETAATPAGPWSPVFGGFRPGADGDFSYTISPLSPFPLFVRGTATAP